MWGIACYREEVGPYEGIRVGGPGGGNVAEVGNSGVERRRRFLES